MGEIAGLALQKQIQPCDEKGVESIRWLKQSHEATLLETKPQVDESNLLNPDKSTEGGSPRRGRASLQGVGQTNVKMCQKAKMRRLWN